MNFYFRLANLLFVYMSGWFIVSIIRKRNDVADIAWGLGFVLLAWFSFLLSAENNWRSLIINFLVTIWGLRLAWHIFQRNRNKPEDSRYLAWRKQWGKWFLLRSYFQVYILQGILIFLISVPVLFINNNIAFSITGLDFLGLIIWTIGFFFEVVGDWQLTQFIKDPSNKGKLMQSGLWQFSRHPNYFGEVTQWWGIFLIALSIPYGWMTIVGPLTITSLILFVSGVPLLEKKYAGRADFETYKRRTSKLIPLPKRSL
jgi:steroid 5-alpha reductase family enzyme